MAAQGAMVLKGLLTGGNGKQASAGEAMNQVVEVAEGASKLLDIIREQANKSKEAARQDDNEFIIRKNFLDNSVAILKDATLGQYNIVIATDIEGDEFKDLQGRVLPMDTLDLEIAPGKMVKFIVYLFDTGKYLRRGKWEGNYWAWNGESKKFSQFGDPAMHVHFDNAQTKLNPDDIKKKNEEAEATKKAADDAAAAAKVSEEIAKADNEETLALEAATKLDTEGNLEEGADRPDRETKTKEELDEMKEKAKKARDAKPKKVKSEREEDEENEEVGEGEEAEENDEEVEEDAEQEEEDEDKDVDAEKEEEEGEENEEADPEEEKENADGNEEEDEEEVADEEDEGKVDEEEAEGDDDDEVEPEEKEEEKDDEEDEDPEADEEEIEEEEPEEEEKDEEVKKQKGSSKKRSNTKTRKVAEEYEEEE